AQVILDRLRAQVESRGGFPSRGAVRQGECNLQFLRRQLLSVALIPNPRRFPAGLQLRHRPLCPRRGAELVERLQRRPELLPCIDAPPASAQALPEIELCSCALENIWRGVVMM